MLVPCVIKQIMETKLCECGCGRPTLGYARTNVTKGQIKGKPTRYLKGHTCAPNAGPNFAKKFWEKVKIGDTNECWPWMGTIVQKSGYGRLKIYQKATPAHRVAWELTYGPIIKKEVCHKCDSPSCCNPTHLFVGIHTDNMNDMAKKLRCPHKLNHNDVRQIRELVKTGKTQSEVAKQFFITQSHVSNIINYKRRAMS